MVSIKKSTTINPGEDIEEKETSSLLMGMKVRNPQRRSGQRFIKKTPNPLTLLVGTQTSTTTMENSVEIT